MPLVKLLKTNVIATPADTVVAINPKKNIQNNGNKVS